MRVYVFYSDDGVLRSSIIWGLTAQFNKLKINKAGITQSEGVSGYPDIKSSFCYGNCLRRKIHIDKVKLESTRYNMIKVWDTRLAAYG